VFTRTAISRHVFWIAIRIMLYKYYIIQISTGNSHGMETFGRLVCRSGDDTYMDLKSYVYGLKVWAASWWALRGDAVNGCCFQAKVIFDGSKETDDLLREAYSFDIVWLQPCWCGWRWVQHRVRRPPISVLL